MHDAITLPLAAHLRFPPHTGGIPPSEPVPVLPGDPPDRRPVVPDPLQPVIDPDDGAVAPVRLPGHEEKPSPERVAPRATHEEIP